MKKKIIVSEDRVIKELIDHITECDGQELERLIEDIFGVSANYLPETNEMEIENREESSNAFE